MSCSDNSEIIAYKAERRMPAPAKAVGERRQNKNRVYKPYVLQSRCSRYEWTVGGRYATKDQALKVMEKDRRSGLSGIFEWRIVGPDGEIVGWTT